MAEKAQGNSISTSKYDNRSRSADQSLSNLRAYHEQQMRFTQNTTAIATVSETTTLMERERCEKQQQKYRNMKRREGSAEMRTSHPAN